LSGPASRLVPGTAATLADYPVDAAWTADGRLVVGGGEGELALVDPDDGTVQALGRHDPGLLNVAILAASRSVVTSGQDGGVRQWDLPVRGAQAAAGRQIHRGMAWPQSLAASSDGQRFAFAAGRAVRVFDASGAPVRSLDDLGHSASLLAWRGRLNEVAAAGQTHAWLCELDGGRVTQIELEGGPVTLSYSPDGRVLAAGLQDGVVSFRYVATQKKSRMSGYEGKVTHTAWSANSRYLASAASGASTVIVWDFGGKGPEGSLPLQLGTHTDRIEALDFQPAGKLLATAGRDWRLALWHPGPQYRTQKEGALPQAMDVHLLPARPALLRWSNDGRRLAVALNDGRIEFFGLDAG
jgi:WD40 repeat protein